LYTDNILYVTSLIRKISLYSLCLVGLFFCFYGLNTQPLQRWDEETNMRVIKQTLTTDQSFTLILDNKPFLEKPPLWYFLTMASVRLFGQSPFGFRFVSALSGFLLLLVIYRFSRATHGSLSAIISLLVMLSTGQLFMPNQEGFFSTHTLRSADVDSLLLLLMTGSFYSFYMSITTKKSIFLYLGSFLSVLSILTKGPIGLLPLFIFYLYIFACRKKRVALLHMIISTCVFLVIVLGWHTYMFLTYKEQFIGQYVYYHLVKRMLLPIEGHRESLWFYLTVLSSKNMFSALEIYLVSVVYVFFFKNMKEYKNFVLVVSSVLILVVITTAQTKLAWYVLPFYPFASLLIGGTYGDFVKRFKHTKNPLYKTLGFSFAALFLVLIARGIVMVYLRIITF